MQFSSHYIVRLAFLKFNLRVWDNFLKQFLFREKIFLIVINIIKNFSL